MGIPFIVKVFRHTGQQIKNSELVLLLRPIVINELQWNNELAKTYDSFNILDEDFT